MKTSIPLNIYLILFASLLSTTNLKPVPDVACDPSEVVHSDEKPKLGRARRSLSDVYVPNTAYMEKQADQESPGLEASSSVGKDNEKVPFALDPLSELFRGHKDKVQKLPKTKQGSEQQPVVWVKDAELAGEALPADEQVECYKMQNIEPPGSPNIQDGPSLALDNQPFTDMSQKEQWTMSRPLTHKERGTKLRGREEDEEEITSLYSDPEKIRRPQKQKLVNGPPIDLEHLSPRTVYRPIGVRPEFPVYDEDIDFHPDPLQGILEDKYWLDPQEQEAVIRKYIDLAHSMQPPGGEHRKRSAFGRQEPKSVNSIEAFRDADAVDRECPCRELAACKDCSNGKWKKQNISDVYGSRKMPENYGNRQLLSFAYDGEEGNGEDSAFEDENIVMVSDSEKDNSQDNSIELEKQPSEDNLFDGSQELESQVEGESPSFTSNFFGRKLLAFEDDEETKEYIGEYSDSEVIEDVASVIEQNLIDDVVNDEDEIPSKKGNGGLNNYSRRSVVSDDGKITNYQTPHNSHSNDTDLLRPSNKNGYDFMPMIDEDINRSGRKYIKPHSSGEFQKMQKPFMDNNSQKSANFYVPNKFGNFLQKSFMRKPKERSTTVDPDLEFEVEKDEFLVNVSIAMKDVNMSVTTEMAGLVKNKKRREQPTELMAKSRRSLQLPLLKHPPAKKLIESDSSLNQKVQDENNTLNASSTTNTSLTATPLNDSSTNISDPSSNNYSTDLSDNTTSSTIIANTTQNALQSTLKPKKKNEEYDEDTFDAEIANDIVETVIAESQSGSVVGHNLGLHRRNESLSKYAKISPESEQLLKKVTECILDRIRDRLEGQSCTLLDDELLQFLKWMVLSGESYKEYLARMKPELRQYRYSFNQEAPPTAGGFQQAQASLTKS